ncbi:hypothetical protein C7974DRAFT_392252 [Boeremia exigua]|uniref:uncharacterized protein n=1 Tax=Boeremia exigua TaxID=749465 RepID=UPI001E8D6BF7|nr:uncharacterized protein C7974DRAFT_392252 [Boeremia exigua]KAH6633156.1 hypothetical protein C7974DRAFT_392252 [Boeremia exigua]
MFGRHLSGISCSSWVLSWPGGSLVADTLNVAPSRRRRPCRNQRALIHRGSRIDQTPRFPNEGGGCFPDSTLSPASSTSWYPLECFPALLAPYA